MPAAQASLGGRPHLSAALGAGAILFRQTNAVWVAFVLGAAVMRTVAPDAPKLARAPAEQQLLQVLRGVWLVRPFFSVFIIASTISRGCMMAQQTCACWPALRLEVWTLCRTLLTAHAALLPAHHSTRRGWRRACGAQQRCWRALQPLWR